MTTTREPPAQVEGATRVQMPALAAVLQLNVQPSIAVGRRGAGYGALVTNRGPLAVEAWPVLGDASGALVTRVVPSRVLLEPGASVTFDIEVRARRPRLARGEHERTVSVEIRDAGGAPLATSGLVFVQQRTPVLWAIALLAVVVAVTVGLLTRVSDRVTVPAVEGVPDVATAEGTLQAAGLQLDPRLRSRTSSEVPPGTIIDQIPEAGARARSGDRVTLLVAISARRSVTPALGGQTAARAASVLRAAGLTLGPVLPAGAAAGAVIDSQLPAAGSRVPAGTAVTLFVRRGRGAAGGDVPGGRAEVPAIDGRDVNAYVRAIAAAGLVPRVIRTVSAEPLGSVVSVQPRPGLELASGDRVRIAVSAGVPDIAFDTGGVVRTFDPQGGRSTREASPPQGDAVEPSWSPDGRRLLYRVGRRLLLVSARLADRGRVLYEGRTRYASATFAPAPADNVLALVRRTGGDGDLCFGRVGQGHLRPRCQADPRWDLGRQISWRKDGRELLVFGVRRGDSKKFGMLRYRSSVAYSTDPADWRGRIATDVSVPGQGVIAASYSPSGSRVALVTSVGQPRFQLLLTSPGALREPDGAALPVRACEVAWRPDGLELAVVQSDDACGRPVGQIVRLSPDSPRETTSVTSGGRHPAYQPLTYAGPKGVG